VLNLTGLALTPGSQRSWWLREALDQEEEGCPPLGRADRGCAGRLIDVSPTHLPTVGRIDAGNVHSEAEWDTC